MASAIEQWLRKGVLSLCVSVIHMGAVEAPQTGVTSGYGSLCRCWELNPGPLEEQSVVFTIAHSLQPQTALLWTFLGSVPK